MVGVKDNAPTKDKRVRFSGDCNRESKTYASEPRKYTTHITNERSVVGKSTSTVKKDLVRNVEEGISSSQLNLEQRKKAKSKFLDSNCQLSVQTEATCRSKFGAPELYSSLSIARDINLYANKDVRSYAEYEHLSQNAKKAMKDKVLLKLNFPVEEKLYKDLIPVKVDDAELICKHPPRREAPSTYCKDVEPQLSDFCKPTGGREFCMWTKPVFQYGERLRYYNGFSLCKRFQEWQV